ncbi:MAG: phosphatase PAP2 family protein [Candidatus Dormibacteria bacterium]
MVIPLNRVRRPGAMVTVSLVYVLAVSGIMIWRGISVSPDYLLAIFIPIAVLSGRLIRFLRDWVPFIVIFLAWEAMRGLATKADIDPHVGDLANIETTLFFGHLPTAWLQSLLSGTALHLAAVIGTVVYFCHFMVPLLAGLVIWLRDRTQFLRFTATLMGMSLVAFIFFLLLPCAPPWYAQQQGYLHGFTKLIDGTIPSEVSGLYRSMNPNPVAAFPSLHSAFPFLCFLALRRPYPRASWVMLGWSALVWVSVVFLGEHYVIDVIAGIALAGLSWMVMMRLVVPRVALLRDRDPAPFVVHPERAVA